LKLTSPDQEEILTNKNMSEEILKRLDEMQEDIKVIKEYIPKTDRVKNSEYRRLRGISQRTLTYWFEADCPREDDQHVSIKAVDEWRRTRSTRKPKK
jgi:hypothetical protein